MTGKLNAFCAGEREVLLADYLEHGKELEANLNPLKRVQAEGAPELRDPKSACSQYSSSIGRGRERNKRVKQRRRRREREREREREKHDRQTERASENIAQIYYIYLF